MLATVKHRWQIHILTNHRVQKLKDQANAAYYYRMNLEEGEQKLYHLQIITSSCFPRIEEKNETLETDQREDNSVFKVFLCRWTFRWVKL